MKRTLLTLMAVLAFSSLMIGQTGWTLVNSNLNTGQGVGQISIGMNNPQALWAYGIAADGSILDVYTKSTDAGQTWTKGTFNAGSGLSQLFAIDETTCWAVFNTGNNQGLYKTTDGGAHWAKQGSAYGSGSFADLMHFFDNLNGVAVGDPNGGYFEIYTTTDGGTTWNRVAQSDIPDPGSGEYGITGDYSSVGDNIWFGTNAGRIFHSTDKGYTWTASLTAYGATETVAPMFADANNGFAFRSYLDLGIEPTINLTTDGGATWTSWTVGGSWYARYNTYVPGTTATYVGSTSAAGSNGICYSYDGGHNWTSINDGYDFQASSWVDVATGWAGSIASAKKSTGGMFVFTGDSLLPLQAKFEADYTAIALGQSINFTNESHGFPVSSVWVFEGGSPGTYTGATPPPITYNTPGSFNVTLKVYNSYTADTLIKTDYIYVGGVGINDLSNVSISVYPNPAHEMLNVRANFDVQQAQLTDLVGKLVIEMVPTTREFSLNTSALNPGTYLLKLTIHDKPFIKKIVVN